MWDEGKDYVKDHKPLKTMELYEVGAIEFFGSYGVGGFPRGYAKNNANRNFYKEVRKSLEIQIPHLKDIEFYCQHYYDLSKDFKNCVIYIDPPYQGTKQYEYANAEKMDYTRFWNWVREISKDNFVFVSEQNAPEDFEVIWEKDVKRTMDNQNKFKATEKLFRLIT